MAQPSRQAAPRRKPSPCRTRARGPYKTFYDARAVCKIIRRDFEGSDDVDDRTASAPTLTARPARGPASLKRIELQGTSDLSTCINLNLIPLCIPEKKSIGTQTDGRTNSRTVANLATAQKWAASMEYGREVASTAVAFHPVSESSGSPLSPSRPPLYYLIGEIGFQSYSLPRGRQPLVIPLGLRVFMGGGDSNML
ncbi:hypothetical protein EVAR_16345_1 [Eumeta japonica]|uniref:Uncharacterized protein n=1 Tax=Eumeta variegata TaxID=151549 RepID=A0A4C1VFR2_EUMVA|nr:hypothetical protein EVAR_16345_1 [Eumeta japonica]